MYEMVDKEYIRKRHFVDVDGWSIREISRTLKIARHTVREMLNDTEVPKYQLKSARPGPVNFKYYSHYQPSDWWVFLCSIIVRNRT